MHLHKCGALLPVHPGWMLTERGGTLEHLLHNGGAHRNIPRDLKCLLIRTQKRHHPLFSPTRAVSQKY